MKRSSTRGSSSWFRCRLVLLAAILADPWGAGALSLSAAETVAAGGAGHLPVTEVRPDAEQAIQNVLLIVSDDLKASVLGCYGDPRCHTPHIDQLAREGMRFENAYCQGTWCAPSRQSFMHSRYRGHANVNLGQLFREAGWYSARVGKIYHMRVPGDIIAGTDGLDIASSWTERFNCQGQEAHTPGDYACLNLNTFTRDLQGRQSTGMPHRMFVSVQCDDDGESQPDAKAASKAIELLRTRGDKPFFLAVGLIRPHYPMVAPARSFAPYPWHKLPLPETIERDDDDIPTAGRAGTTSSKNPIGQFPDNQRRMWTAYYAAVTFMDEQVGRILAELDRLGLRESTAVVFTSDHGYHLGEHGFWQKSNLHEEVTRVPLVIAVPGMPAGVTQSLAELVDLYPTLAELAGLDVAPAVQGVSLVPTLHDPEAVVRQSALSLHNGYALRTRDWAYMRYKNGSEELYAMESDPQQFFNLVENAPYAKQLQHLRDSLRNRLTQAGLPD